MSVIVGDIETGIWKFARCTGADSKPEPMNVFALTSFNSRDCKNS